MKKFILFFWVILISLSVFSQVSSPQWQRKSPQELQQLANKYAIQFANNKAEAVQMAIANGWTIREEFPDGTVIEIMRLGPNGMPVYYITENLAAAITTGTNELWTGGGSGLDLDGSGFTIAEWDGGGVRTSHWEFRPGIGNTGVSRVTQKDAPVPFSSHATHVAGTLIAEGEDAAAHGMAPAANLHAYDSNHDTDEVLTANATDTIIISNHSYGEANGWRWWGGAIFSWRWHGDTVIDVTGTEDYHFGFYDTLTKTWDSLAYVMQDFLFVRSAGNDRVDSITPGTLKHQVFDSTLNNWKDSWTPRPKDGGADGFDCLNSPKCAKNILVVGAVLDIPGGYTNANDVVMTEFSNWGPTDDGRIKPDIVGNGWDLYSTDDDADDDYVIKRGTSQATPNVCGTLALLQDYYDESRPFAWIPQHMSAAQLKALVIHTANEAGPGPGPDFKFGWGLLNAEGAADLIHEDSTRISDYQPNYIKEYGLTNNDTLKNVYYCDGTNDINITLCWTDPPGIPVAPVLNPLTLMLINDLDVELIEMPTNNIVLPWVLDPDWPDDVATRGDNNRDNVEKITSPNPTAGYYNVNVSHKGVLASPQDFALIVTGMEGSVPGIWTGAINSDWGLKWNWNLAEVPDTTVEVTIPAGCPNYPILNGALRIFRTENASYYCASLAIYNGATVTINGHNLYNDSILFVEGSLIVGKDLILNETSYTQIYANGLIYTGQTDGLHGGTWIKDWATFEQASGEIHTESIKIEPDAWINITGGLVKLYKQGFANAWQNIEIDSESCTFYNLTIGNNAHVRLFDCGVAEIGISNELRISGYFDNNNYNMAAIAASCDASGTLILTGASITISGTGGN